MGMTAKYDSFSKSTKKISPVRPKPRSRTQSARSAGCLFPGSPSTTTTSQRHSTPLKPLSKIPVTMPTLPSDDFDSNLKQIGRILLILLACVIASCVILAVGIWLAVRLKCCGCCSRSRVDDGEIHTMARTERNWYGRRGQDRSRWRSLAISEPDLGPNFASTLSGYYRSGVEMGSLDERVEGKRPRE